MRCCYVSYCMEDILEHMQRVTTGLAVEAAKRIVAANPQSDEAVVRSIVQQILLDWFMGEFFPLNETRQAAPPPGAGGGVMEAGPIC